MWQPLRHVVKRLVVTGSTNDVRLLGPVPQNQRWRLRYVFTENNTGGSLNTHYRIDAGSGSVGVSSRDLPADGFATGELVDIWMFPSDVLYARVLSNVSAGPMNFGIMGEIHFAPE